MSQASLRGTYCPPNKKQIVNDKGPRAWIYLGLTTTFAFSAPSPYQKGKSYGKGKSKSKKGFSSKGKGKAKSLFTSKGKGKDKGKAKGQEGKRTPTKENPFVRGPVTATTQAAQIK